jgi:hypothetical protein
MAENFYNDMYYYSPSYSSSYYPGYRLSRQQDKKYLAQFPYIQKEPVGEKDLQIFYNTTDNNTVPWGSTYKYTIPKSIDDILSPAYNSISERQKRFRRELFGNTNNIKKSKINIELYFAMIIIILFLYLMCL